MQAKMKGRKEDKQWKWECTWPRPCSRIAV